MTWWIWILIGFALLAFEFVSTTMHIGLFAVGAFVVGILVGVGVPMPLWGQVLIFTTTSLAALFFIRPIVVRKLGLFKPNTVDTMIGEKATAIDDIAVQATGKAEMRGTSWNARNVGPSALARGEHCTVERIDGLVLHVRAL
jgi:membrane protein implicated in regulation of membrane protease activity